MTSPKPPLWRRTWAISTVAGIVGLAIGGAAGGSGASSSDRKAQAASHRADLAVNAQHAAEAQITVAKSAAASAGDQAKQAAQAAVASQQASVDKQKADLQAAQAKVAADDKAASDALTAREKAVGTAEATQAANTVPGDGTFIVGQDIKVATYKSQGGTGCYWKRLDRNGEIIDNNLGDGPSVLVVRSGDAEVEIDDCAPFVKTG